jgi:hypothetical protein
VLKTSAFAPTIVNFRFDYHAFFLVAFSLKLQLQLWLCRQRRRRRRRRGRRLIRLQRLLLRLRITCGHVHSALVAVSSRLSSAASCSALLLDQLGRQSSNYSKINSKNYSTIILQWKAYLNSRRLQCPQRAQAHNSTRNSHQHEQDFDTITILRYPKVVLGTR